MKSGTLKWSDLSESFGVIIPDDQSQNIFIHISQLKKLGIYHISDGQKIGYEVAKPKENSLLFSFPSLVVM